MRFFLGFVFLCLVTACNSGDLPDYYRLGGMRVLAIKTTPSEVDPSSGSVNVSVVPLVTDLNGAGRALTYVLETCVDPGVSFGAEPSCTNDPAKTTQTGSITLTGPKYTQTVSALTVAVPMTIYAGRTDNDKYNGISYLVTYQLTAANGDRTKSFKRITATTRTPQNVSPSISALQQDGTSNNLSALPSEETTIKPVLGGSAETYSVKLTDGSLQSRLETFTVTWFLSDGKLKRSRSVDSNTNVYTPPDASSVIPKFIVAVIRDSRGGVDFVTVGP